MRSAVALLLSLAACGSPQTAQPVPSPPPARDPARAPAPPPKAATKAAACPLLCWIEQNGSCQRPNLTKAQLDNASCGLRQQLFRSRQRPAMVPCPSECCPQKGSGTVGDRDADGIPDDVDRCPDEPEDYDGFEDHDGCPDPDNDSDGVLDYQDKCCFAPGNGSLDGCPRP
jgi:hypothetical protein